MKVGFLKAVREKFGIKLFTIFTLFILVISLSFTASFVHHQSKSLTDDLINRGRLFARILSCSTKIGVFSENEKLLEDPVQSIFQQEEVLEVAVFNLRGKLLSKREKPGIKNREEKARGDEQSGKGVFSELRQTGSPLYLQDSNKLEFWSPVSSGAGYPMEESLFFEEDTLHRKGRVIGFVRVTLDKIILRKELSGLLLKSILMGVAFLVLGSGITYFVVRGITKPLNNLTERVKGIEMGKVFQKVPVETEDEIGKLGKAFNDMSESLARREEALRESESKLRFLSSQLLKAHEKERMRLSKELHDELGQILALLKIRLRSIQGKSQDGQSALQEEFEYASQYIDQIIESIRRLSRDLSPSMLEDLGLSAALRCLTQDFAKQHSIQVSLSIGDIDHLFSQEAQTNLYRIFQEALTNISRHAKASRVSFTVKKEDNAVSLVLEDDGKGFNVDEVKAMQFPDKGMGLTTMDERARMLGGNLDLWSKEGVGTRITLTISMDDEGGLC